jgi:hypothetical protein
MSEWQPIETAPKDGTRILLYAKDCAFTGAWRAGPRYFNHWSAKIIEAAATWRLDDGSAYAATHWMPLPEPPR